jgi:hypothetical protein
MNVTARPTEATAQAQDARAGDTQRVVTSGKRLPKELVIRGPRASVAELVRRMMRPADG